MKKPTLTLDALHVESFDTSAATEWQSHTVEAQAAVTYDSCSCEIRGGCPDMAESVGYCLWN